MAHFAEIDENNIVLRVLVTDNNDPNGDEGYQWLIDNLGGRWIKTSRNCKGGVHYIPDELDENGQPIPSGKPHLRFNFAEVGSVYDEDVDVFIPPKPPIFRPEGFINTIDWVLDKNTYLWKVMLVKVG
jgi:hypothetical protein